MSESIYRFVCDDVGIYEAVEKYCPRDDQRRECKPDGSWLPKVGTSYPGSVSFWTDKGFKKYFQSGLQDWHCSVVDGHCKFLVANRPQEILYEDEYQIICNNDCVEVTRELSFIYQGVRPAKQKAIEDRPSFIRHYQTILDWNSYAYYSGSEETFTAGAPLGKGLGLKRIGIHREILKPGKRSSWPHAHKVEEELVYILSGAPDIWINGKLYTGKPGEVLFFPPDTNFSHTIINNSQNDIEIMVFGEQEDNGDLIYYPMHPERNEECKRLKYFWEERPEVSFGNNDGVPGNLVEREAGSWDFQKYYSDIEEKISGGAEEESQIFYKTRDLGRALGAKRVALHRQTLPTGYRSSLPHAESLEEEFIHVLKGSPIVWVNGKRYQLAEGDSVAFANGTGIAHTLINESGSDVELIVSGETTKSDNLCSFPMNPEMKDVCGIWWENAPEQEMGNESPFPLK